MDLLIHIGLLVTALALVVLYLPSILRFAKSVLSKLEK
jgi:ABC-type phosphate transport system permease subunit